MDFSSYFPIWNKLTPTQQQILERNVFANQKGIPANQSQNGAKNLAN